METLPSALATWMELQTLEFLHSIGSMEELREYNGFFFSLVTPLGVSEAIVNPGLRMSTVICSLHGALVGNVPFGK